MRIKPAISAFLLLLTFSSLPESAGASSRLERPSYWINRLSAPEKVILTDAGIAELNRLIIGRTDQMAEMREFPDAVSGETLLWWLLHDPVLSPENGLDIRFKEDGGEIKNDFFASLADNMNLPGIMDINPVIFGVVIGRADIRAFPADEPVFKRPGGKESDTFQYSAVYPPEPAALLHLSKDLRWGFFQTSSVRGWIRLDKVAFAGRKDAVRSGAFIVVTGSMVNVYKDRGTKKVLGRVPMGTVLHLTDGKKPGGSLFRGGPLAIMFPVNSGGALQWVTGYLRPGEDVKRGFLPYTAGNAIKEAFKMLGEGYGWGGKGGGRDCSAFIKDVFATMGIMLPRNSARQAFAGDVLAEADTARANDILTSALEAARPGITLLALDGHIMLYIGTAGGHPYVIHQIAGYMDGDRFVSLYKTSVTRLEAGDGVNRRRFRDRLKSVTEVVLPAGSKTAPERGAQPVE
ncbi:MAG: SH3 domain-containing protein [Deltaproteobacteria bacterium]|nr:SH3 domain-containing protein [Deltaproteobacteria bacterium]